MPVAFEKPDVGIQVDAATARECAIGSGIDQQLRGHAAPAWRTMAVENLPIASVIRWARCSMTPRLSGLANPNSTNRSGVSGGERQGAQRFLFGRDPIGVFAILIIGRRINEVADELAGQFHLEALHLGHGQCQGFRITGDIVTVKPYSPYNCVGREVASNKAQALGISE